MRGIRLLKEYTSFKNNTSFKNKIKLGFYENKIKIQT